MTFCGFSRVDKTSLALSFFSFLSLFLGGGLMTQILLKKKELVWLLNRKTDHVYFILNEE